MYTHIFCTCGDAILGVPPVSARDPGQLGVPTREEVEEAPGNDDVVVEHDVRRNHDARSADALQCGTVCVRSDGTETRELPERQLHEEERQSDEEQHEEVRDEKRACANIDDVTHVHIQKNITSISKSLTSSILVGQVGKAPDVSEADSEADAGEDELELASPRSALRIVCVDDLDLGRRCHRMHLLLSFRLRTLKVHETRQNLQHAIKH